MLLNLGLTANAAAAHANEPIHQPETQSVVSTFCSPTFSLSALPLLNSFYNLKLFDGSTDCPGLVSAMAMSSIESASDSGEGSTTGVTRPRVSRSATGRKPRSKTSYQFAHPVAHARHKRLKIRPKLLLQLQQVSQAPRPLPVVDILSSTSELPLLLARRFPAIFRTRNRLGPYDLIVVLSEQYNPRVGGIPGKQLDSEDEDESHREVVATICQKLQEDARLKGKAEICLNFGPVWEASPLPSGSYEFVAQTDSGVQIVRWALRGGRNRRMTTPSGTQFREGGKRFTFSVIDPTTRRHPVLASMTRNQLEIHDEYSMPVRSGTGHTTPSSGMSVASDASDGETPLNANSVPLDDGLRTLIIVTGIWVAFREGWSDFFRYGDPMSASPMTAKNETNALPDNDKGSLVKDPANGGKRCMSISNICRSNTTSPVDGMQFGNMSKRSNSTGAAFMDRAKRRSASGLSTRLNRHSMFTTLSEDGHSIVVSRPPSIRQNSAELEDTPQASPPKAKSSAKAKRESLNPESTTGPDRDIPTTSTRITQHNSTRKKNPEPPHPEPSDMAPKKSKLRNRLSSVFGIFHRKHDTH